MPVIDPPEQETIVPCGECHLKPGETCDVCGAREALVKTPRALAKKITDIDRETIDLIKASGGFVNVDRRGEPGLESTTQMNGGRHRLRRLEALGLAEPSADGLVEGLPQTWRLTQRAG